MPKFTHLTPNAELRRAVALTKLSKKLNVLELAKMIGHRDTKSLMIYYRETADEIADKLG